MAACTFATLGAVNSHVACRENFERCFGLNNLICNSRMKLGLVTGLLVLLRELSDFDCEGHRARAQDVDHAEVPEVDVEAQLLEDPAVPVKLVNGQVIRFCYSRYESTLM